MKKVLLVLTLVASSLIYGQSLIVLNGEKSMNISNSTVLYWTDSSSSNILQKEFHLVNTSASYLDVKLVRTEVSVVSGTHNYYCWDFCYDPSPDTSGIIRIEAGDTTGVLHLIVDFEPRGKLGTSTIKYTFFDINNPSDSTSVTTVYNSTPVGIKNNELKESVISNIFPNPAHSIASLNYNLEGYNQKAKVVLYDMLGNTVKEFDMLANSQGKITINTSDIPNGVYFYALRSSDKTISTKRLIVNH